MGGRRRRKGSKKHVLTTRNSMGWVLETTNKDWASIKVNMDEEVITPRFMRRKEMEAGSLMSSLAQSTSPTRTLSPDQRARADQSRLSKKYASYKDLLAKPGPGTYNPQLTHLGLGHGMLQTARPGQKLRKSPSFATTMNLDKARNLELTYMSDPGALALEDRTIKHATSSKSTFQSWLRKGSGGFGPQSARELHFPADMKTAQPTKSASSVKAYGGAGLTATPSPFAYSPNQTTQGREFEMRTRYDDHWRRNEDRVSAVFKSKGPRIADSEPRSQKGQPGPGAYHADYFVGNMSLPGASMGANLVSKVGRDTRYTGDTITPSRTIESEPRVGPGAYSPERTKSGARSTIGGKADDEARPAAMRVPHSPPQKPATCGPSGWTNMRAEIAFARTHGGSHRRI